MRRLSSDADAELAVSRRLDASEGHLRFVVHGGPVDVADARLDSGCDLPGTRDIAAEYRGSQPELVVICAGHGLLHTFDSNDRFDWCKGLILEDGVSSFSVQ